MMLEHLRRMARYNQWANRRLYAACRELTSDEYHRPRPAFFGSIHATLNHILVGDRIWLARIEGRPAPGLRLDDQPCAGIDELEAARAAEDERIIALVDATPEGRLEELIRYRTLSPPSEQTTPLHICWLHLFNHQTHHRGQVHDQLPQTGVAPPPLDLIYYLRAAGGSA